MDDTLLPNGEAFAFWDDATEYSRTLHVAQNDPNADDASDGSTATPLATIGRAAELLQPGEKVIVHQGVYRECVRPARGGTGPDQMIAYEAADDEDVTITGAEIWRPEPQPSEGWNLGNPGGAVWMADLPVESFGGYNPFLARNAFDYSYTYGLLTDPEWMQRMLLRRAAVFYDGKPLKQVFMPANLGADDGVFWVEEPGSRIHFRLPRDQDPSGVELTITAREQVFAPRQYGLGYIRLSGFVLEHAADGLPVPQRAAVSATRGHHWIIEDCRIRWANGCGMDLGSQSWNGVRTEPCGHHLVRRNAISDCGVCGIAGARGVEHSLFEDNLIERIGGRNLERMYECAAIKFHFCRNSLFRRNVFRHIRHAGGIWLDVDNCNCRITGNVFADIETITGGVYSEMNFEPNMIDHNVFWDVRSAVISTDGDKTPVEGSAIRADCNESLIVAHNFFGNIQAHAIAFSLVQSDRAGQGRTGLCRANTAVNNIFYCCPHRIHLGRREKNWCDGNLYHRADDSLSFEIANPAPRNRQNLAGWQTYFALDEHSVQAEIVAALDPNEGTLSWHTVDGAAPECQPLPLPITEAKPGPAL